MIRVPASLLLILLLAAGGFNPDSRPMASVTAITHVTIIDATGSPPQSDMTVLIDDNRITEIGKAEGLEPPADAQTIDATGKFLIPGLWDMHVHALHADRIERIFSEFVANGVLGIRDMGAPQPLESIRHWRRRIASGAIVGPRVMAAGPILDGPEPMFPNYSLAVSGEAEAHRIVASLKRQGVDFIKVYSLLQRDAYFAIAEEAKLQGIRFAGHVPESVSAAEASDAGQASIEHLSGIWLACSAQEEKLRKNLIDARSERDVSALNAALSRVQRDAVNSFNERKAEVLFAKFAKNGTWHVPTLIVAWAIAFPDIRNGSVAPTFARLRPATRGPTDGPCPTDITAGDGTLSGTVTGSLDLIAAMRQAGVEFMAGTDAPNLFFGPGSSLHDELAMFVRAGFTPMEALQSATLGPARYLGLDQSLGTVEAGKIADLVLLDANPLEDIKNTRMISAVVLRGRVIRKSQL